VVEQLEPIRAWRGVSLNVENNTVVLGSINHNGGRFGGEEATAKCGSMVYYTSVGAQKHQAPGEDCDCGFYGVMNKKDAYGLFIAEADFYGKVIEHQTGWRAQYQRILSLRVVRPKFCAGAFLCDGKPELLVFTEGSRSHMIFNGPPTTQKFTQSDIMCIDCAANNEKVATIPQIAARLGMEVRWDD
jgi:hypothetical protein